MDVDFCSVFLSWRLTPQVMEQSSKEMAGGPQEPQKGAMGGRGGECRQSLALTSLSLHAGQQAQVCPGQV